MKSIKGQISAIAKNKGVADQSPTRLMAKETRSELKSPLRLAKLPKIPKIPKI